MFHNALRRFLLVPALAVLPSAAHAAGHHSSHSGPKPSGHASVRKTAYSHSVHKTVHHSHSSGHKAYHLSHGKKFSHGYYYAGHHHKHWTKKMYWKKYGCYCYWCPDTSCWYYWCAPRDCWFPCSYAVEAAPTCE